ncbi:MAG: MFS transporter [Lysobacterales bacterium]
MIIVPIVLFVCLIGVGIVIPLFPFFGARVGASPEMITMLIAVFAFGQFLSSPFWGWLSDRIGRKPVMVISLLGATSSFVLLAIADTLTMLFVSRIVGGLMTGIAPVAFAVAADTSSAQTRAGAMARIGVAFSLGLIAGPILGGLLAGDDPATANYFLLGMVAGAMTTVAALITLVFFKETLPAEKRAQMRLDAGPNLRPLADLLGTLKIPALRRITLINFCFAGALGIFDSTYALFANARIGSGPEEIGLLFAMLGIINAVLQGLAVSRIVPLLGEWGTVLTSVVFYGVGLVLLGSAESRGFFIASTVLLAIAFSLFIPTSNSLASKATDEGQRGAALGVFQGASNLARSITPLFSGYAFARVSIETPFVLGSLLLVLPAWLALRQALVERKKRSRK